MKVLLHACCGPCSLEPVRLLQEAGHEPVIFYANSNIAPASEYTHRLETLRTWADTAHVAVVEGVYDPAAWEATVGRLGEAARTKFGLVADEHAAAFARTRGACKAAAAADAAGEVNPLENAEGISTFTAVTDSPHATPVSPAPADAASVGNLAPEAREARRARCRACYRLRFAEAARYAAAHSFDALGTTLSVSPYQYTDVIREELERACETAGVNCAFQDYRPFYDEATRRSREAGMYRQNYCGCRFSDEEATAEREARKRVRALAREAEAAAHANERAAARAEQAAHRNERQAYAEKQAHKRAILKALRQR